MQKPQLSLSTESKTKQEWEEKRRKQPSPCPSRPWLGTESWDLRSDGGLESTSKKERWVVVCVAFYNRLKPYSTNGSRTRGWFYRKLCQSLFAVCIIFLVLFFKRKKWWRYNNASLKKPFHITYFHSCH